MAEPTGDVTARAGEALRKIDRHGQRGLSLVTYAEIEAMALLLIAQAERLRALEADKESDDER